MASTIDEAFDAAFNALGFEEETVEVESPEPETTEEVEATETTEEEVEEPEGEDEEDGDESEEEPPPGVVTIDSEDQTIRLPDGTEVSVKDAALFQADYTRKTQALAEERKALEAREQEVEQVVQRVAEWYEERQANPVKAWTDEIAASPNPTQAVSKVLLDLGKAGLLSPEFMEHFGIEAGPVAHQAQRYDDDSRVAQLEQRLEQQTRQQAEAQQQQELIREYQRQFTTVVAKHGIDNPVEVEQFKTQLLEYARDNQILNLEKAYAAMVGEGAVTPPRTSQPGKPPAGDPATTERKRAAKAVAAKSASGPGNSKPVKKQLSAADIDGAVASTVEDFFNGRS